MKSKDLSVVIEEFVNSNHRSILIDGPWGCGKTYQYQQYREKSKKKKIFYVSLFGKESIDEINTELYRIINPKIFKTKKIASTGLHVISKAILPIPYANSASGSVDALGFLINNLPKKNITKNRIIVFDDLERVDNKLSYISLLGYINSLFLTQTRIICLCSTGNIEEEKVKEFHDFKEKIFDRMYVIDESDEEIISSYFDEHNVENLSMIIKEFDNNLRQAQKVALFFNEIIRYSKEKEYKLTTNITYLQLIRCCNQTIKICFNQHKKPMFDSSTAGVTDSIYKLTYDGDVKALGENIANGIHNLLRVENIPHNDPNLQRYSEEIIKGLICVFLFRNYANFDKNFKPKPSGISAPDFLDNEVYYLSDENKDEYVKVFFKRLYAGEICFDKTNTGRFADILRYTNRQFNAEERNKLIEMMFEHSTESEHGYMDVGDSIMSVIRFVSGTKDRSAFEPWVEGINKKRKSIEIQEIIDKLKNSNEFKEYTGMDLFINQLESRSYDKDNKVIIDFIVQNDFLLPDLSGDISYASWRYAHAMARYSSTVNKKVEFIEVALKTCNSNLKNESLIDRFDALISYNINSDYKLRENLKK